MRILILTVGLLLPFTLAADTVNTVYLTAALSAIKQVPPVAGVDAGGDPTIQVHYRRDDDGNVLYAFVTYTVNFRIPPSDAIVAMHIHEAPADRNGPIRIGSGLEFGGEPVFPEEGTGRIWRQAEIEIPGPGLEALDRMLADPRGFYVNIHSESHPPGLLRGQLRAVDADMISDLQADIAALRGQHEASATLLRRIGLVHGVVRRGE